jgi:hypothetical protein
VRLNCVVPVGSVFVEHAFAQSRNTGVVDKNVEATKLLLAARDGRGQRGSARDIEPNGNCWSADGPKFGKHEPVLLFIAREHRHAGACAGQARRDR